MAYLHSRLPEVSPISPVIDDVGQRLLAAAQIIRERGWCQGDYSDARGAVCTLGALLVVDSWKVGDREAIWKFEDLPLHEACRLRFQKYLGIDFTPQWNDAPGRTVDDVLAALTSAASQP